MSLLTNNFKQQLLAKQYDLQAAGDTHTVYLFDGDDTTADPAAGDVSDISDMDGFDSGSEDYAINDGGAAESAGAVLGTETILNGTFDADNVTGSSETGSPGLDAVDTGQTIAALVITTNVTAGASVTTAGIICVISSGTGLGWSDTGLSTTGNPVDITWSASGIFSL